MARIKKISTHGSAIECAIMNREEFRAGSLVAEHVSLLSITEGGDLTGEDREVFLREAYQIRYVVWSFGTPIYWVREDGHAHRVSQHISVATAKHQSRLPQA